MNYKKETIQSKTDDFKALILKRLNDLENKTKIINAYSKIIQATKKEYQNLHNENVKLKKITLMNTKTITKYNHSSSYNNNSYNNKIYYKNNTSKFCRIKIIIRTKKSKQKQQVLNDINSLEGIDLSKLVKSKRKKQKEEEEISESEEREESAESQAEATPPSKK